jgi:hypothetical protein
MVLATRAASTRTLSGTSPSPSPSPSLSPKRVRRAPNRSGFELVELPRSPIRKKPRPREPREKKGAPAEEGQEGEFNAVMRGLMPELDAAAQLEDDDLLRPEDLLDPEDLLLMPQFATDLGPRSAMAWTPAEDAVLASAVNEHGPRDWPFIAQRVPGRIAKQCRERWHHHLNPNISKDAWTEEEDLVIQMGVAKLGHKWSEIALQLPGRTDNATKNRYNARIKKMGGATITDEKPRVSDADFMHELMRRNVLAEERKTPGRFSPNRIEALAAGTTVIVDAPGCRWSNEEHVRLAHALPVGARVNCIDWVKASRAVPTRSALSCRRHWAAYLRGGWKPTACKSAAPMPMPMPMPMSMPMPEPEPEPAFGVDVDAAFETLKAHGDLLSQCAQADQSGVDLVAIETYSEGSCDVTWSRSSILVVGNPGVCFRFHTPGTEPPPPSPLPDRSLIVRAEKVAVMVVPPAKPLETAALLDWMKQKEAVEMAARKARQQQQENELVEKAWKVLEKKERAESKKRMRASNTVNAYFHAVKQHDQFGSKAHWPQPAAAAAAAAAAQASGA